MGGARARTRRSVHLPGAGPARGSARAARFLCRLCQGLPRGGTKSQGKSPGRFPGKSRQSPAPSDIFKGLFQPKWERGFLPHASEESGGQRRARHVSSPRPAACHQILLQPRSPELPEGGRGGCTHRGGEGPSPRPAPSAPQDWGTGQPRPAPSAPPGLGALNARAQYVSPEQLASHPRDGRSGGPDPGGYPRTLADLVTPLSHGVSPGVSLW